jgi:hypothetical protein
MTLKFTHSLASTNFKAYSCNTLCDKTKKQRLKNRLNAFLKKALKECSHNYPLS